MKRGIGIFLVLGAVLAVASALSPGPLTVSLRHEANDQARREMIEEWEQRLKDTPVPWGRRLLQGPTSVAKPGSAQIFLSGVIEAATLDPACPSDPFCGGTITVSGVQVLVPKNLIVFMPAQSMTWQELFTFNPKAATMPGKTGLALADPPGPAGMTYIADVTANRLDSTGKTVAALISITQAPLMVGAGYIDSIDMTKGEIVVESAGGAPGARIRLNDPSGKYGMQQAGGAFDARFQVDSGNPTVRTITGFPMCIPSAVDDPKCPSYNRPIDTANHYLTTFTMADPASGGKPDPNYMVPFVVGDYIRYAGVLAKSDTESFVAAFEVVGNLAVYTAPLTDPAYVVLEVAVMGTGGVLAAGLAEAAVTARFEGFTTDPARPVQLYAIDYQPNGDGVERDWGQQKPDPGPTVGAVKGRWRFKQPCPSTGPVTTNTAFTGDKGCTPPFGGSYIPPPREVRVRIIGCATQGAPAPGTGLGCLYTSPSIEYVFPEQLPGQRIVENNFNSMLFLTQGGYPSGMSGKVVGPLNPWPSDQQPTTSCLPPVIDVGGPYSVVTGGSVTLTATATGGGAPYSFIWAKDNVELGGSGTAQNTATITWSNVFPASVQTTLTAISYTVTVTSTKCPGAYQAAATVDHVAGSQLAITAIPSVTVVSGATKAITATLVDPSMTAKWVWTWPTTLPSTPTQNPLAGTAGSSSTLTFTAPTLPVGSSTSLQLSFTVQAQSAGGSGPSTMDSSVITVPVTVRPPSDNPSITRLTYDCGRRRLTVNAVSDVVSTSLNLYLLSYTDNQGKLVALGIPSGLMVNQGAGTYTQTFSGVKLPSLTPGNGLVVQSSLKGVSLPFQMTSGSIKGGSCTI